jgi:hypothetical protein
MHAAASAASARHTHQLEAQQRAHEEQLGDERAQWRLQREQLLAAAAEQQRQWEQQQRQWHEQRSQWEERLVEQQKQQQRQWHEQRSQWEQQLAEQQRRWDGQRRRLEEEAAAASAPPDSECVQCELLRKQVRQLSHPQQFLSTKLTGCHGRCVGVLNARLVSPHVVEGCELRLRVTRREMCACAAEQSQGVPGSQPPATKAKQPATHAVRPPA